MGQLSIVITVIYLILSYIKIFIFTYFESQTVGWPT